MKCTYSIWMLAVLTTAECCYSFGVVQSSTLRLCSSYAARHNNGATQQLMSRHTAVAVAATTATEIDTGDISVALPSSWRTTSSDDWSIEAADILTRYGVVALTSSLSNNNNNSGLISTRTIDQANESATSRLQDMQSRILRRGVDPNGIEDGPYRFAEIVCRDEGGLRYDVPLPWLGHDVEDGDGSESSNTDSQVGSGRIGAPLTNMETEGVTHLHQAMDEIVPHVLEALWSSSSSYVAAAGFLINKPGSKPQNWHKDGPDAGFIDCFVPLIDLNEELGPTAFRLDDNDTDTTGLVPLLNKGNILLFDYRTMHRGQGNTSEDTTRTLAYTVYRRREIDGMKKMSGDVHNFPAALTLEYD